MRWKRLLFFLLINVLVSAGTTLLVLNLWERYRAPLQVETSAGLEQAGLPPTPRPATPTPQAPPATGFAEGFSLQPYQVKAGETLGEIAIAFDISVEELLALNGRTDPNAIGAGEVLFVPVLAETEAPTQEAGAATMAPPGDPVQTEPGDPQLAEVQIVTVIGMGDLGRERVQVRGSGEGSVQLSGWQLRAEDGSVYIFPSLTLYAGGAIHVHTRAGLDTPVDLYWGRPEAAWSAGQTVQLLDAQGTLRAVYEIP